MVAVEQTQRQHRSYIPHTPTQHITISGRITTIRYNRVFEQLTVELDITGTGFEFFSRKPLMIRRFLFWYDHMGAVVEGMKITITINTSLEITGFE